MSVWCHFQTHAPQQQLHSITSSAQCDERWRHSEADDLGGLEVDYQLDLGLDLLDRRFGSLVTLENTSGIDTSQTAQIRNTIRPPTATNLVRLIHQV
jgi:hypothetical protein